MNLRALQLVAAMLVLSACAEEPPPRSVQEFVDNSILLEAAMVRCSRDRVETRYEAECINAREAIKIIEAREDAIRRKEFEALSEQKRRALRETQAAAAEARRRAAEQQRLLEEAEYLAQFGALPDDGTAPVENPATVVPANVQGAVVPVAPEQPTSSPIESPYDDEQPSTNAPQPAVNAPGATVEPEATEPASDLESIREELKRRQDPQ